MPGGVSLMTPPPRPPSEKLREINAKSPHSRFERHHFSGLLRHWQFLSFPVTHPFPREVLNGMLTYVNLSSSLEARSDCFHSNPVHSSNLAIRCSWLISDGSAKLMDVPHSSLGWLSRSSVIGQSAIGQPDCIVFCSLDATTTSRRHFLQ